MVPRCSESMEPVQAAGQAALTFEERNRVINAKFRDMVAVCGNVVQEAVSLILLFCQS